MVPSLYKLWRSYNKLYNYKDFLKTFEGHKKFSINNYIYYNYAYACQHFKIKPILAFFNNKFV